MYCNAQCIQSMSVPGCAAAKFSCAVCPSLQCSLLSAVHHAAVRDREGERERERERERGREEKRKGERPREGEREAERKKGREREEERGDP